MFKKLRTGSLDENLEGAADGVLLEQREGVLDDLPLAGSQTLHLSVCLVHWRVSIFRISFSGGVWDVFCGL